jgi:acetyl-CoA synthetase (ADP-forming)
MILDQPLLAKEIAAGYRAQAAPQKPLINVVTFGPSAQGLKDGLDSAGLPFVEYSDTAARIAGNMAAYASYRAAVAARRAGESSPPAKGTGAGNAALDLISSASRQGRVSLLEPEAYDVCRQYAIPVPPFKLVDNLESALSAAKEVGYPLVLKVVSAEILHKTDIGGVVLGINSDSSLEQGYKKLVDNVRRAAPHIQQPSVLIQKMMPSTTELVLGALRDKLFGPTVMFGLGGIYIEAIKLVAFRLSPLGVEEAKDLIRQTLPAAILRGARGRKPMNLTAVASAIVSLSRLLQEQPLVEQVDLNPFLPYEDGGVAVDARIIISQAARA